jgi:hypothetical protein
VVQVVVECLPSKREALSSTLSAAGKKKKVIPKYKEKVSLTA